MLYILNLKIENPVLVLDGLTSISLQLHACFKSDYQKMFFIASQQVFLGNTDKSVTQQSFKSFPWKLEDYSKVCNYYLFWENLDLGVFESTTMKKETATDKNSEVKHWTEMIYRKFYFAGHSPRWMFREGESKPPDLVLNYAGKVECVREYLFGTRMDKADDAVNHILIEIENNGCRYILVSVYAAKILALISRDSSRFSDCICISASAIKDAQMMGLAYEVNPKAFERCTGYTR